MVPHSLALGDPNAMTLIRMTSAFFSQVLLCIYETPLVNGPEHSVLHFDTIRSLGMPYTIRIKPQIKPPLK